MFYPNSEKRLAQKTMQVYENNWTCAKWSMAMGFNQSYGSRLHF